MTTPARRPFVIHFLCPSRTYSSPSRTARTLIACTSDPAWGSVMENAPRSSPVAIRGSSRPCCSRVPKVRSIQAAMKCVFMTPDSEIHAREISATILAYVTRSSPSPPCSSGMAVPKSPSSHIRCTSGSG
jgi:hypothetical protein